MNNVFYAYLIFDLELSMFFGLNTWYVSVKFLAAGAKKWEKLGLVSCVSQIYYTWIAKFQFIMRASLPPLPDGGIINESKFSRWIGWIATWDRVIFFSPFFPSLIALYMICLDGQVDISMVCNNCWSKKTMMKSNFLVKKVSMVVIMMKNVFCVW